MTVATWASLGQDTVSETGVGIRELYYDERVTFCRVLINSVVVRLFPSLQNHEDPNLKEYTTERLL